jgi:hypothetical protein
MQSPIIALGVSLDTVNTNGSKCLILTNEESKRSQIDILHKVTSLALKKKMKIKNARRKIQKKAHLEN